VLCKEKGAFRAVNRPKIGVPFMNKLVMIDPLKNCDFLWANRSMSYLLNAFRITAF